MTLPNGQGRSEHDLSIRRAMEPDLPLIRQITLDAYDIYEPLLGFQPLPVTTEYGPDVAAGTVWLGILSEEAIAVLVTRHGPDHLLIYSLAVRPERQGEGHARTLLDHAEQEARTAGHRELRLFTNALMHRNIALYQRCGFREHGRRVHPSRPDHEVVDMVRVLA